LCIRESLFVAQIKVTSGTFICAQIEVYEYTNRIFSVDMEHYYSYMTFISFAASATVGAAAAAVSAAAISVDAFATAAILAATTIAISAAIAAAFWLIVVCPHHCFCFRLPPPFLPAPAIATAAVCRRQ
jgi:hypothetical protein